MSNIENSILKLQSHQERAYESVEELYKEGRYAAVVFPTGCGKSFVTLKYIEEHPDKKILFLSPRCAINEQMYEYIVRQIGGRNENVEDIKKEFGTLENAAQSFIPGIKNMTYQSLLDINKKDSLIRKILDKVKPNLIVVDEMHHIKTKGNTFGNEIEEDEEILTEEEKQERRKEENEWGKCFQKLLDECPDAKVLGLSATPIRTDGANVVERIFENSVASEISLLEAMELGIITPPRYVVPDFIKEDELQTLLEKIENADEDRKPELKQKYDELVEKSDKAPGIPELMDEHITQRDGKYIVFCKDIKDMEDKKSKAKEWFGKVDEEPTIYSVSTYEYDENGEKRKVNSGANNEELKKFENDNSEYLKVMYCVGMIDEGVHLKDVSGVILVSKTGSRPTYLQRLGRTISSGENQKETLVIDLVNNNEILLDRSTYEKGYEIEDIEALEELVDWIENKNEGELPDLENAKTNKEIIMARRLRRLNNKYYKYVEDEKLLENLDEDKIEEIENIIMLGEGIGLWDEFIELDEEEIKITNTINNFQENTVIKGARKDFQNLMEKIEYKESPHTILLRVCEALVDQEYNFNNFVLSKRINKNGKKVQKSITLEEIAKKNPEIDIKKIIEESGVKTNYPIGKKIENLKYIIKGTKRGTSPTEEEKRRFEELGVINIEEILNDRESANEILLRVCEVLVEQGYNFNNFVQSKRINENGKNVQKYITLKDLANDNIELDIEKILGETGVKLNYPIGDSIKNLKKSIKDKGSTTPPTEEEKRRFEELGVINIEEILIGRESAFSILLRVCEALVEQGYNFNNFVQSKKINTNGKKVKKYITLENLANDNLELDIEKILEETGVELNYPIGNGVMNLKKSINGKGKYTKPTEGEKEKFQELGVINIEEESANKILLRVCEALVEQGYSFNNFVLSKRINKNGKKVQKSITLEDIAKKNPEIDIEKIIEERGVKTNYPIGKKIEYLKYIIKSTKRDTSLTEEEKRRFEELGVIKLQNLIKGKELCEAGLGSDTKLCDEISDAINKELEKNKIRQKSE